MKGIIQIEGEVNDKVDNVFCVRRPERVALRRDNGSPHCHTKDNSKQLLWELNYTGWGGSGTSDFIQSISLVEFDTAKLSGSQFSLTMISYYC